MIVGCKAQSNGQCVECFNPFKLSSGKCTIDNCLTLGDFGCGACQSGYYLKPDGLCYKNDLGCSLYRAGTCYACQYPYILENGQCKIDGCSNYGTTGSCSSCSSPYKLISGFCKIDNC